MAPKARQQQQQQANSEIGNPNESGNQQQQTDGNHLDSRRAWLVLLVVFIVTSSISGSSRVYGLVFARQVAADNGNGSQGRESASWPLFTCSTVDLFASILTPALAGKLSWRQLEFMSAFLFILSNLGAYFSRSLALDVLCLGIIQGLAVSINSIMTITIVNHYFCRYRTTAFGLALSGSTCGLVYLGPLANWLLERPNPESGRENFRLVYLGLAACASVNLGLVLFLKPANRKSNNNNNNDEQNEFSLEAATKLKQASKAEEQPAARKISRIEWYLERKHSIAAINLQCKTRRISTMNRIQNNKVPDPDPDHRESSMALDCMARSKSAAGQLDTWWSSTPLFGHRISTHSLRCNDRVGDLLEINSHSEQVKSNNERSQAAANLAGGAVDLNQLSGKHKEIIVVISSPTKQKISTTTNAQNPDLCPKYNSTGQVQSTSQTAQAEPQMHDIRGLLFNLIANPYTHCVWILLGLYYLISRLFIIVLADFGSDRGLSRNQSTALLNYWSAGELFGRLALAALIDLRWFSMRTCLCAICTILSVSMSMLVWMPSDEQTTTATATSYLCYSFLSFLIGSFISLEYVIINAFMVEYLGASKATSCYSLAAFIAGILLAARPTLIGLFRDKLGSYDGLILLLAGSALCFALIFYLLEPIFRRYWPRDED